MDTLLLSVVKCRQMQKVLDACGISQPELQERIRLLEEHIGQSFIESILKRKGLDVQMINQICERSILVESLSSQSGFNRIRNRILRSKDPMPSFVEPHGEWFQLVVGYVMKSIGEQLIFEQKIEGVPKDILLRGSTIHIECKSFGSGAALKSAISDFLMSGKVQNNRLDSPPAFTVKYEFITSIPAWYPGPLTISELPPSKLGGILRFIEHA